MSNTKESPELDVYTKETHSILNDWYSKKVDGIHFAHQPIYGYRTPYAATSNIAKYMVTKSVLSALGKFNFENFIDIGGAEGYTANLVRTLFGANVQLTDLSDYACRMAKEIFEIEATQSDIHNLPFENEAFQVVLCSETIEHVSNFKLAIQELLRITKDVLVITVPHETPEIVAENIRLKIPHAHINYFDINTLDYLKEEGYTVTYQKTLSPLLIVPRVVAEAFKKPDSIKFKLYNSLTPIFQKIFGIKTANRLIDLDAPLSKLTGLYSGITFVIRKSNSALSDNPKTIRAKDFTGITVPAYRPDDSKKEVLYT